MKSMRFLLHASLLLGLGLASLPCPAATAGPPAVLVSLGRKIFFDPRLSADGRISCASCHQPQRAYSDGLRVARGIAGREGRRNTPSLLNVGDSQPLFWDGRRPDLESQAFDPLLSPKEHGLPNAQAVLALMRRDRGYAAAFRAAYRIGPGQIGTQHVRAALASFQRSLDAGRTAFDRYYFHGEHAALSASALRGLALFQGAAGCTGCHVIGAPKALFTDNRFHSLSVGFERVAPRLADLATRLAQGQQQIAQGGGLSEAEIAELGRFLVTLDPADIGAFRTPSLRNVALTAPYMHDGSVPTLREAVEREIYYRSLEAGQPLVLTPAEKDDLLAFLHSLSSSAGGARQAALP